jgi:hypothetical protein
MLPYYDLCSQSKQKICARWSIYEGAGHSGANEGSGGEPRFSHQHLLYQITILITYLTCSLARLRARLGGAATPRRYQNCHP